MASANNFIFIQRFNSKRGLMQMLKEMLSLAVDHIKPITLADIAGLISAVANVIMAVGVIFAAKSIKIQKHIHLVDLHNKFQSTIRSIQQQMPHDINDRIILSDGERRIIRLYWYSVFDEWFTCWQKSNDKAINALWKNFIWGAKSGIYHIPAFASDFVKFRGAKPFLLGTHDEFFKEIEEFCAKGSVGDESKQRFCAILFGAPCSGKTSISNTLQERGWIHVSLDKIIKQFVDEPTTRSFSDHAESACLYIYKAIIDGNRSAPIVVELGCLFPKEFSNHLRSMLALISVKTQYIRIDVSGSVAKSRARERNRQIVSGESEAIIIDDIDQLPVFFKMLHDNTPDDVVTISSTDKSPLECADIVEAIADCK